MLKNLIHIIFFLEFSEVKKDLDDKKMSYYIFWGLLAMALGLWFLAFLFSWLKAKIDVNVERYEAKWKRQEKKEKRNRRTNINQHNIGNKRRKKIKK